ncbi:MAG: hypothetical protein HY927_15025 [Elusimicrobia bacterium]|nr:hypothetical protein [Elusimicrobiota bacterium]
MRVGNPSRFKARCFKTLGGLSWAALAVAIWSCAPKVYIATEPPTNSPWGGKYAMTFNPPEKKAAKGVPVTIAVVNPAYKGEELSESALANPLYGKVGKGFTASMGNDLDKILIAKGVTTVGPFSSREEITYNEKKGASVILAPQVFLQTQIKYAGDFAMIASGPNGNTLTKDKIERYALKFGAAYAKGGVSGPGFKQLAGEWAVVVTTGMSKEVVDEWARKFASGELLISTNEQAPAKPQGGTTNVGGLKTRKLKMGGQVTSAGDDASFGLARFQRNFTMTTSGWVYFIMQEPLSGEKLWVKKLELEPIEVQGAEAYAADHNMVTINDPCLGAYEVPQGLKAGETLVYDGRADAMATTLQKMYPIIMQKFETYLDPAEIEGLKQKGQEIREHKVY